MDEVVKGGEAAIINMVENQYNIDSASSFMVVNIGNVSVVEINNDLRLTHKSHELTTPITGKKTVR